MHPPQITHPNDGQVGAPRPGGPRPGREDTDLVGNRERLARLAVHAVPPHPARDRRGTGGGEASADLSPCANPGRDPHDALGSRARRPPTTTAPEPPPGPPSTHGTGLPRHMRGRRTQPRPDHSVPPGSVDLALRHGTFGLGHPLTLHPATGPARPGPLVVHAVWYVMAGSASHAHLPGRVFPLDWQAPTGAPKLAETQAAGNREAVAGIPGPEVGRPGGCGHHDPSHRSPMPGPGVGETVPRVATQPPRMGGH